jgi:hypothetical protein
MKKNNQILATTKDTDCGDIHSIKNQDHGASSGDHESSLTRILPSKILSRIAFAIRIALLLGLFLNFYTSQVGKFTYEEAPKNDRIQYLTLAYNMINYGTFSHEAKSGNSLSPSRYRPPGYPVFLAANMLFSPSLQELNLNEILSRDKQILLQPIKKAQLVLLFLGILSAATVAYLLSGSWICFFTTLALGTNFPTPILRMSNEFLSENLTLPLVSFSALALLLALQTRRTGAYLLSGILIGCLALTRAVYFYFWLIPPLLFIATKLSNKTTSKSLLLSTCAFLLGFWITVSPYMFRNLEQFGSFQIVGGRGGRILFCRVEIFNKMRWDEVLAGFVAYSPRSISGPYLEKLFKHESYYRFDSNHPEGFRQRSRAFGKKIKLFENREEKKLKKSAVKGIIDNPVKHIAVSTLLAYRGAIQTKFFTFDFIAFIGLYALCFLALIKRNSILLAAFIVPLFGHSFYAFTSHFIPRYGRPHIAINIAAGVLFTYFVLSFLFRKIASISRRGSASTL